MTASVSASGGGGDLMGVREAAREIGVNASTISRQIRDGIIPNRGTSTRPMVSLAEAREARRTRLDVSKQRGASSALFGAGEDGVAKAPSASPPRQAEPGLGVQPGAGSTSYDDSEEAPADDNAPAARPGRSPSAFVQVRTAREGFAAKNAQLDYLERRGRLVGQHGVKEATADVFRNLRDRVLAVASTVAGRLATMQDEREIRALLRAELSRSLTDASEAIDDRDPDPLPGEDGAEDDD